MNVQTRLSQRQKAAVIVRLLLDDETEVNLTRLDHGSQTLLAEEMAGMELIDRSTRDAIIAEFCADLESVGLTFPGDLDGTLALLGARISDDSANQARRMAALAGRGDPWDRLCALPREAIQTLARDEPVELVAVMLSKLPVGRATEAFTSLDRDRARSVAQAMALTGGVSAAALHRIGLTLLRAADALPRPAIDTPAADRVGAMLNFASAELRDDILDTLDHKDADFAGGVRKAIFIFAHIPARVAGRDVPRVLREVEQPVLLRALSAQTEADQATADFLLANVSQRMADGLREELAEAGRIRPKDAEDARTEIIAAIRRLEEAGELTLLRPDAEAEADA